MTKAPAYQRYPKDYMSDGNVLRMNFEERGIYDWLLDSCWIEDGIPSDVGELARICSLSVRKMRKAWERVAACFIPHPRRPGWLTNSRLEKERQVQAGHRDAKSKAGQKGAQGRWHPDASANSNRIPEPMAKNSSAVCSLQSASAVTSLPAGEPLRARAGSASPEGNPEQHPVDDFEPTDEHRTLATELRLELDELTRDWRLHRKANGVFPADLGADLARWILREPGFTNGNGHGNGAAGAHEPPARVQPAAYVPPAEPQSSPEVHRAGMDLVKQAVASSRSSPMPAAEIDDPGQIAARERRRAEQLATLRAGGKA